LVKRDEVTERVRGGVRVASAVGIRGDARRGVWRRVTVNTLFGVMMVTLVEKNGVVVDAS
jgi:hypothetical protein